jgi:hypothetical protein
VEYVSRTLFHCIIRLFIRLVLDPNDDRNFAFLATFYLYRRRNIEKFKGTQAVVNEAEAIDGSSTTTETEREKVATLDAATPSPPVLV